MLRFAIPLVLTPLLFLIQATKAYGQSCPGCAINNSCFVAGGGLCPDSLPGAVVGSSYNQDVTFYLPEQIDATSFSGGLLGMVDLLEMKIDAISGLPFGLNWSCNNTGNNCTYYPAQGDSLGCVKICGVPVGNPGVYNINIFVTATVDAGVLGAQQGQTSFANLLVLLPDTSSNNGFSMAPGLGCAPLTVNFINNFPSNGYQAVPGQTQGYVYTWDFGNGLQSNVENPPSVTYVNPGQYPVQYSATVDTFGFQLNDITVTAVNCTDLTGAPDLYLKVFDGSNNEVFSTINSPTTSLPFSVSPSLTANNPPYRVEVWDDDSGFLGSPDDNCFDNTENPHPPVTLPLPAVNQLGNTTQFFSQGNTPLAFNYTYAKNAFQVQVTDTVQVLPVPPQQQLVVSPGTQVCSPDSVLLHVGPGFGYEWFFNDTLILPGAQTDSAWVSQSGSYKVRVFDLNTGCFSFSNDTTVSVSPGIPGNFAVAVSAPGVLNSNISGFYAFQWIFLSGTQWVNIPAPAGTQSSYTVPAPGDYGLIAETPEGCKDTAFITVNNLGFGTAAQEGKLYPNPSSGQVFLELPGWNGEVQVGLMDMQGRMLYEQLESMSPDSRLQLDFSNLPSGLYRILVRQADRQWTGNLWLRP